MANEIRQYTLTIPAATTKAAPVVLDTAMPPREIVGIEVIVPPGANGNVGFQVLNSGLAVIPYGSDTWLIPGPGKEAWDLAAFIDSGSWQLAGYNTGQNDHSLFFRFLCNFITTTEAGAGTAPLSATSIESLDPANLVTSDDGATDDTDSVDLSGIAS